MDILAFPAARVVGRGGGPRVPALGGSVGVEGRELGLERALLEGALRFVVSLVGDPGVAGDLLEGLDRAVGGGRGGRRPASPCRLRIPRRGALSTRTRRERRALRRRRQRGPRRP